MYDASKSKEVQNRRMIFAGLSLVLMATPIIGFFLFFILWALRVIYVPGPLFVVFILGSLALMAIAAAVLWRLKGHYDKWTKGIQYFSKHMIMFGVMVPYKDVVSFEIPGSKGICAYKVDKHAQSSVEFTLTDLGDYETSRGILEGKLKKKFVSGIA